MSNAVLRIVRRLLLLSLPVIVLGCATGLAPTPVDTQAAGTVYYLSPSGSDTSDGRSPSTPWKTFGRVFNAERPLVPGDTLVLMDGTYLPGDTGLPNITPENARHGEPDAPITIRAQHERRAWLRGDGSSDSFSMRGMRHWVVDGLVSTSADNPASKGVTGHPFIFVSNTNLTVRRCVGAYNNRYANTHIFHFINGAETLFEECEAYFFHRHGFSIWQSRAVTLRRCYTNSRDYSDIPDGAPSHSKVGGDESFVFYGSSQGIAENCISERLSEGFDVHGGVTFEGRPGGTSNKFLGCISLGGIYGALSVSNKHQGAADDNLFNHLIVLNSSSVGVYMRWTRNVLIENATIIGDQGTGLAADEGPGIPCAEIGCSFVARNILVSGHERTIWVQHFGDKYRIERVNAFPSGRTNVNASLSEIRSDTPIGLGTAPGGCIVYVPENSNMKRAGTGGADIGATVLYRYEDGVLTREPLWNPRSGQFPHGALVKGLNDISGDSLFDVHRRLNVATNGCPLPPGYGRR